MSCVFPIPRFHVLLLVSALLLTACGRSDPREQRELTVSAAISLKPVLQEIARVYETAHPDLRLRLNFASSGTLQQQIEHGAPVDVFVSAAEQQMNALAKRDRIVPETRRILAANELVLIVPASAPETVHGFRDLAAPGVERVALGAPASVPAGKYATDVLRTLGILDSVLPKAIQGKHVRQVLTYVERGEVDAGLVYRTDAAHSDRVRIVATAPPASHPPITYSVAVVRNSAAPERARELVDYLLGAEAQAILRRHGFRPAGFPDAQTLR